VIAALVLAVVVVLVVKRDSSPAASGGPADRMVTIKVDGAALSAEVMTPEGKGPAPLVVMPGSWGGAAAMYHVLGMRFAQSGYQVVAYAQRGWGGSTGDADFGGAKTQQDATAVIDWALAHTRADAQHIGMLGASYGAGISLLTAAHDKRVRAVVALSTWTDVAAAFDQNGTPNTSALQVLIGPSRQGHFDATVLSLRKTLVTAPADMGAALRKISPDRSPMTYVDDLNKNQPAIMLANGFEDSIFNPAQLLPFYDKLTTPKRLELAPGDHGGPELAAFTGGASPTVEDARMWLDHYLRGVANGIDKQPPILLRDIRTGQPHPFTTWPKADPADRIDLAEPGSRTASGEPAVWSAPLQAGTDSVASAGPAQYVPSPSFSPPRAALGNISTDRGLVWSGPALGKPLVLNGVPSLRVNVASSGTTATLYAYLYDVGQAGFGTLLDMAPFSITGLKPGKAKSVTVDLQPASYTIPVGDRIALVIDAADPRYQSLAPAGTKITVSSTAGAPAWLGLPLAH
jgi:predicted acyl esterase